MTSSIPSVIEQQTRWARSKGFEPRNAYLTSLSENLRQQLSDGAQRDFERGRAGELRDRGIRPAKMNALRSSAALSVNVFDYWRSHDPAPLRQALDLREKITRISFEEHFSTGLKGSPPNIDVLLTLDAKYFPSGKGLWTLQDLPNCQALATNYRELGPFKHLDAPQLLKHALGL